MSRTDDLSSRLGEVFALHGPAVYRRALRLLGNQADAEEATQEIFIRAMRASETFRGDSQVTTWLYRITTNYCLNQIRDRRRRRELFAAQGPDDAPEPPAPSDLLLLRRLLSQAQPEQAQVAVYVHLDGMTHEEAAELMGVSRRTAGNLLARFEAWARERLGREA